MAGVWRSGAVRSRTLLSGDQPALGGFPRTANKGGTTLLVGGGGLMANPCRYFSAFDVPAEPLLKGDGGCDYRLLSGRR